MDALGQRWARDLGSDDYNLPGYFGGVTASATDWGAVTKRIATATDALARLLFTSYVLPFEVVSVLLLMAVIGGIFLAKREGRDA